MLEKMLDDIDALTDVQERTCANCSATIRKTVDNVRKLAEPVEEHEPMEALLRRTVALQKQLIEIQKTRLERAMQEINAMSREPFRKFRP